MTRCLPSARCGWFWPGPDPLGERRITTVCCDEEGGPSAKCGWVDAVSDPLGERRITTVCCAGGRERRGGARRKEEEGGRSRSALFKTSTQPLEGWEKHPKSLSFSECSVFKKKKILNFQLLLTPRWDPKKLQKCIKNPSWAPPGPPGTPEAAQKPPGSHLEASREPFWSLLGTILGPFW